MMWGRVCTSHSLELELAALLKSRWLPVMHHYSVDFRLIGIISLNIYWLRTASSISAIQRGYKLLYLGELEQWNPDVEAFCRAQNEVRCALPAVLDHCYFSRHLQQCVPDYFQHLRNGNYVYLSINATTMIYILAPAVISLLLLNQKLRTIFVSSTVLTVLVISFGLLGYLTFFSGGDELASPIRYFDLGLIGSLPVWRTASQLVTYSFATGCLLNVGANITRDVNTVRAAL